MAGRYATDHNRARRPWLASGLDWDEFAIEHPLLHADRARLVGVGAGIPYGQMDGRNGTQCCVGRDSFPCVQLNRRGALRVHGVGVERNAISDVENCIPTRGRRDASEFCPQ